MGAPDVFLLPFQIIGREPYGPFPSDARSPEEPGSPFADLSTGDHPTATGARTAAGGDDRGGAGFAHQADAGEGHERRADGYAGLDHVVGSALLSLLRNPGIPTLHCSTDYSRCPF